MIQPKLDWIDPVKSDASASVIQYQYNTIQYNTIQYNTIVT